MQQRRAAVPLGIALLCLSTGCGGGGGGGGPIAPPVATSAPVTATPQVSPTAPSGASSPTGTPSPTTTVAPASPSPSSSAAATATGTPATGTPAPVVTVTPVPANSAPPVGPQSASSIFLGDQYHGAVLIYASASSGNVSPSAVIAGAATGFTDSTGSSPIFGLAVDPNTGTVYVLTQTLDATGTMASAESVLVFAKGGDGNVAPTRTISLPTTLDAESLAFANGSLYVTDASGAGAIDVFPATASGSAQPASSFAPMGGFANTPSVVSFDGAGKIYVATYDQTATAATEATQGVYVFPATSSGTTAATTLSGASTGFGNGVLVGAAVDGSNRLDVVVDDRASDVVADLDEFAAGATGNTAPATTFQDTTAQGPVSLAVDAAGNLYVSEIGSTTSYAQVNVFAPAATTPSRTLQAYEAALPLIAIGPFVAADASASAPVSRARSLPIRSRRLRARLAAIRGAAGSLR